MCGRVYADALDALSKVRRQQESMDHIVIRTAHTTVHIHAHLTYTALLD
jgi:hypothetical protein